MGVNEAMLDKALALLLAVAGLAALVFGHLTDGAETAALFVTVSGAAGTVGLQVLTAVARAVLQGQVTATPAASPATPTVSETKVI